MKKTLLFAIGFCVCFTAFSQQFFDDFESYNDGDLIALTSPNWNTWGNAPGTMEDTPVSNEQAYSGDLSLRFEATGGGGGPTDIILPFGQKYESGIFTLEMQMYIPSGRAAYFNLQGEVIVAQVWSLQYFFISTGIVEFRGDGNSSLGLGTLPYPHDQWFNVKVVANMSFNEWEVFVDGNSAGVFSNPDNYLASLNLYPVDALGGGAPSQFYVDDVFFEHEDVNLLDLDAQMVNLNTKPGALTGREIPVLGEIKNTGVNTITSMEISWTDGNNTFTDNMTGLNITSLDSYEFTHDTPYTVVEGSQNITVTIESVNSAADEDMTNNSLNSDVTGYTPAAHRKVLVEEGTGTWCGFCPRGEVIIGLMVDEYEDYFIPIAVHDNDPMEVSGYVSGLGFNAFPTMSIAREEIFNFLVLADVENRFFQRITEAPDAKLFATAMIDNDNNLTLTAHADFLNAVSGNYKFAMVLVEDEVTGTGSGYNQVNYYSGGGLGPMGGYENLPDPVPASQMVYYHVGRALFGGVSGESNSLPATINAGDKPSYEFGSIALPSDWDMDKLKVVTILLNPDGSVNNVEEEKLSDLPLTSVGDVFSQAEAKIYPNPFNGETFIELNLETPQPVKVIVFNALGERVAFRDYGNLNGNQVLPFIGTNMNNGFYFFQVHVGDISTTEKVLLSK